MSWSSPRAWRTSPCRVATSAVPRWGSTARYLPAVHSSTKVRLAGEALAVGRVLDGRVGRGTSACTLLWQSRPAARPTPRGSNPTTSNRSLNSSGRRGRASVNSIAEPPGPPGFTKQRADPLGRLAGRVPGDGESAWPARRGRRSRAAPQRCAHCAPPSQPRHAISGGGPGSWSGVGSPMWWLGRGTLTACRRGRGAATTSPRRRVERREGRRRLTTTRPAHARAQARCPRRSSRSSRAVTSGKAAVTRSTAVSRSSAVTTSASARRTEASSRARYSVSACVRAYSARSCSACARSRSS